MNPAMHPHDPEKILTAFGGLATTVERAVAAVLILLIVVIVSFGAHKYLTEEMTNN
jgi:hypothetical protein